MHSIRLRGPWATETLPGEPPATRHTRHFHRPTNLAPSQQVWLVIDQTAGLLRVELNGAPLWQAAGAGAAILSLRLEVASILQPRSEFVVEVAGPDAKLGDVRIEIEDMS